MAIANLNSMCVSRPAQDAIDSMPKSYELLGHTGYWTGSDWGTFETQGGYFRNRDGCPVIECQPIQDWKPPFVITVERWINERRRGAIRPTKL